MQRKGKSRAWQWDSPIGNYELPDPHPEITNPAARRVLNAALKAIPINTRYGPVVDDPEKCSMELFEYQRWLHARLHSSGLAKGLAGGPAFLPDIAGELNWPWNILARVLAPRNYEQLTRLVAGNLEWYLDQSRPTSDPFTRARSALLPSLVLTMFLLIILLPGTGLRDLDLVMMIGVSLLIFAVVFTIVINFSLDTLKHATNTSELYHYLLEAYKEPHTSNEDRNTERWKQQLKELFDKSGGENC